MFGIWNKTRDAVNIESASFRTGTPKWQSFCDNGARSVDVRFSKEKVI